MSLSLNNWIFQKHYSPDDASGPLEVGETETFELLNEAEAPESLDILEEKGKGKEKEGIESAEETEEEDELKELEDELKPPSEEDINELVTPVRRKEILAKYPKLFKDFPYLEKAYYREQQFTELMPTIADAKLAVDKARILDQTERDVMGGDISNILSAVKAENQEVFNKIADNYLPALRQVDQQAYYHVLGNVIKDTIVTMVKEGRALGEQGAPLQAAANILNQFVFGSQNFQPPTTLSRQTPPDEQYRQQQIQQEEQGRAYQHFESIRTDLQTRADNVLRSTIDGHIDPTGSMTDYVRNHAKEEAFNKLEDLISKDTRFRSLLDKLWEKAFQTRFDKGSTEKIKSAYLSKAKTLLPSVIKQARNNALKGSSGSREDKEELIPKRNPIASGRSTPPSSGRIKSGKDIPRGVSTLDFLMKD